MSEPRKIKRVKFIVDLLFTEAIDKKHIPDISHKIADALRYECDSGNGFAPDESSEDVESGYTTEIRVFNDEAGITTVKIEPGKGWVESFEKINEKPKLNIIELPSVGTGIDSETGMIYPQFMDNDYDLENGTHLNDADEEWIESLSKEDKEIVDGIRNNL